MWLCAIFRRKCSIANARYCQTGMQISLDANTLQQGYERWEVRCQPAQTGHLYTRDGILSFLVGLIFLRAVCAAASLENRFFFLHMFFSLSLAIVC
jgi:hypothetical protein